MLRLLTFVCLIAMSFMFLGCGSNERPTTADDGNGHGASYACGTKENPVTFVLKDVLPAAGASVPNKTIVEKFTVVDPPFLMDKLLFVMSSRHTAGTSSPMPLTFTVAMDGKDQTFSTTIDSWSTAPGHVELSVKDLLVSKNDCVFEFPVPLFSYDVTSP